MSGPTSNNDIKTTTGIIISVTDGNIATPVPLPAFDLTVIGALVLVPPSNLSYPAGTAISYRLARAAGGGTLSYTLTGPSGGALPDWLNFDPGTRRLSGTPTKVAAAVTLTYTVTRSDDSETAMQTFTVTVTGLLVLPDPADQFYSVDRAITDRVLPEAIGDGTLSYTLTGPLPALPSGLNFDPGTRTLSGTPTKLGATELTYRVKRSDDNATVMQSFIVTVTRPPVFPSTSGIGAEPMERRIVLYYKKDEAITPLVFPAATGSTAPLTYSLTGDAEVFDVESLGFAFNGATRTLSGTPIVAGRIGGNTFVPLTYAVNDQGGGSASVPVFITLCEDTAVPAGTTVCSAPRFSALGINCARPSELHSWHGNHPTDPACGHRWQWYRSPPRV